MDSVRTVETTNGILGGEKLLFRSFINSNGSYDSIQYFDKSEPYSLLFHGDVHFSINEFDIPNSAYAYPNPVSKREDLNIESSFPIEKIQVFDLYGNIVKKVKLEVPTRSKRFSNFG